MSVELIRTTFRGEHIAQSWNDLRDMFADLVEELTKAGGSGLLLLECPHCGQTTKGWLPSEKHLLCMADGCHKPLRPDSLFLEGGVLRVSSTSEFVEWCRGHGHSVDELWDEFVK